MNILQVSDEDYIILTTVQTVSIRERLAGDYIVSVLYTDGNRINKVVTPEYVKSVCKQLKARG